MDIFEQIAENRIRQAQEEGFFDNVPGKGRPFEFQDENTPEDLRMCHKLLRNANCLPPVLELRKEIYNLRQLMESAKDEDSRVRLQRELNYKLVSLGENSRSRGVS
jgi:hypothetical protein